MALLLVLHDIGKFSPAFQAQKPELFQSLQNRKYDSAFRPHHTNIGYAIWHEFGLEIIIRSLFPANNNCQYDEGELKIFLEPFANAVIGHHGLPPDRDGSDRKRIISNFDKNDIRAVKAWISTCLTMFLPNGIELPCTDDLDVLLSKFNCVSWLLAGLTVLCDWLRSNVNNFPFQKP